MNLYTCMQTNSKCYKNTSKMTPVGILWHSTGANNPNLKRYVQPSNNASNYNEAITKLGKNTSGNDWNHVQVSSGVNAWIGKFADGSIGTVQSMPWDYKPWGCGSGSKGSCNNGWIQFEICEDNLNNKDYAQKVYDEAVSLTAYLCKQYNLNPNGVVTRSGISIPVITCHNDVSKLGFGTSHSDINHWFPNILGKDMSNVREDVAKLLNSEATSAYSKEWINGIWYNEDGSQTYSPKGGWKQNSKGWWYEDTSGWYPTSEWAKIDGDWYYFDDSGYMVHDTWIDGYWLESNGKYNANKKQTQTSSSYKVKVTANALNVRSSASSSASIKKSVKKGTILTIVKTKNGWSGLANNEGWVMSKYVKKI